MKERICILHGYVPDDASSDEQDVLVQRDEIAASLSRLGFDTAVLPVTLNLEEATRRLGEIKPLKVFNLVESLGGYDRLLFLAPALLESLNIAFTGSSSDAIMRTTNKLGAKRALLAAGLPTPAFMEPGEEAREPGLYMIKSCWDHASIGIGEDSVIDIGKGSSSWSGKFAGRFKSEYFAEKYIDGREFNIALLQGPGGPEVLPHAEMTFRDYPEGKLKIVDYRAKWESDSFEYRNTVRSFIFPARDTKLLERLSDISLRCWSLFRLRGYARVDFRVDAHGEPWILEVNVNPCLSSDAGFMAAAAQGGIGQDEVVKRIFNS